MTAHQLYILSAAQDFVTEVIENEVPSLFVFHNIDHTRDVAKSVQLLSQHHELNDEEEFVLFLSAWFHDTGFKAGRAEDHEAESIKLAKEFLRRQKIAADTITLVAACIHATRMPQVASHTVQKILCDADLYHLGTDDYPDWNSLLKQELTNYHKNELSEEKWRQENIGFLSQHRYCTSYAQQTLEPVKQRWIKHLKDSIPRHPQRIHL